MSEWRIVANYETDCCRCPDVIFPGDVIVRTDAGWCHVVCGKDLERMSRDPDAIEREETVISFGSDGSKGRRLGCAS